MMSLVKKCLVCIVLLSVAACATSWRKPEVELVDVRLAGGNLLQQNLKLQLRVSNPNGMELGLDALQFDLLVAGSKLASGHTGAPVVIPAHGEGVVEIEARAHVLSLLSRLPQLMEEDGLLHYRIQGEANIHRYGKLHFDRPGTLDPERLRLPGQRQQN